MVVKSIGWMEKYMIGWIDKKRNVCVDGCRVKLLAGYVDGELHDKNKIETVAEWIKEHEVIGLYASKEVCGREG